MVREIRVLALIIITCILQFGCEQKSGVVSAPSPAPTIANRDSSPAAIAQATSAAEAPGGKLTSTASGLKYQDLEIGDGPRPGAGQTVTVRYVGKLENGKEFDSGKIDFAIGDAGLIKGWNLGVGGARDFDAMKVGGKRRIVLPPELAFGNIGEPGKIPPNATVSFEIELVKVSSVKPF